MLELDELVRGPLPATLKGLPARAVGQPLGALGAMGLSVLDDVLPFPVALLRESALRHNASWMADFAVRAGASLCPHGKTTMAPQLFDRQLRAGAWGMTAATASHVRTYRKFGVRRIVLANQLVGAANMDLVFDELADEALDLYVLVDSLRGLEMLRDRAAARCRRPVQVLLEAGSPGGRTGVRSLDEGVQFGRAVRAAAPTIVLRGIEAFEGTSMSATTAAETGVRDMMNLVDALARAGMDEGWFGPGEVIVSAGGSAYFDIAAAELTKVASARGQKVRVVLRSGCYLSHDPLHYERMQPRLRERSTPLLGTGDGLKNALEVWSVVQSVPEVRRAIVALGKRDISYDIELPAPLRWYRAGLHTMPVPASEDLRVVALNDQHAYVDTTTRSHPWQVGDLVGFGVGHPCTTFDKWPLLYVVDDGYRVIEGIRTFF